MKRICCLAAVATLSALANIACESVALGGQHYVDDFAQPVGVWRFGNAIFPGGKEGMRLNAAHSEVTLPGTVVHPNNVKTFKASLRWSVCKIGSPTFSIGWGKPSEWSPFDECLVSLSINGKGQVSVRADQKPIGTWQLPLPENDTYTLTFAQEPDRVVLRVGTSEASISLPQGHKPRPGYLTLRLQGGGERVKEQFVNIRRIEIDSSNDLPPLTTAERHRDIQVWAKQQLQKNRAVLERIQLHLQAETKAGRWGYPTSMTVSPGLVRIGEKVEVTFHIAGPIPSPCEAKVLPDHLSANPGTAETLKLDWKPDGNGGQSAKVELTPNRPGNWRIEWRVNDEQLSRVVGVIDSGYAVCRLLLTTYPGMWKPSHLDEAHRAIHAHGLTADYWDGSEWQSPFSRSPEEMTRHYRIFADLRHRSGDRISPLCNAKYLIVGCPDGNMCRLDEDIQREGIQMLMRLWDQLGIGPLELFGSYTYGHNTPRVARELGIKAIDSLVPWQNWRDGGNDNAWLINQWGAPTVPFYVADDDYRKVASGRSIVGLAQCTSSSIRMYNIFTSEGQPQLSNMRAHSDQMGETSNIDRFQTVVDLWLGEAPYQREPLFLFIGLENFVDSRDWDQANTLGVNYLREQAKNKKLVFASGADIADYFQRHYDKQPENWIYWPDTYCGYRRNYSYNPRLLPDRIELSNAEFHTLHEQGAALPRFFWDFTQPWSQPVWDDQAAIRKKFGLCDPQLLTADNCVPRMANLDGVKAGVRVEPTAEGARIRIEIESSKVVKSLPVAIWGVPLQKDGLEAIEASPNARFISVVDGSTENVHGIVVCRDILPGKSTFNVRLQGASRRPLEPGFRIGEHVQGRVFLRNGTPYVYVWLPKENPQPGTLEVNVPAGKKVRIHYNDGHEEESVGGIVKVVLDKTWQHMSPFLSGLTAEELTSGATFVLQSGEASGNKSGGNALGR